MEKIKLLLDTDIGTDIDDAVCLAYLLSHPRCELMGITTCTGEAEKRAMIASAICRVAGKDVPIFPGMEHPLVVPQLQTRAAQASALDRWDHQVSFPRDEAVEFLRHTIRSHPGTITLVTIAPLTNIGKLFSIDHEIPSLLKGLVMMCGRFLAPVPEGYGPLEWNATGDPHATSIVYNARVPVHRSIGLDVTSRVSMSAGEFRSTMSGFPLFAPVLDFAEVWFKDWDSTTFHDPLAAATVFEEQLCTFDRGRVEIDLTTEGGIGETGWTRDGTGPHEIATDVVADRFFEHFLSISRNGVAP